ncbi:MAG: MBL fold metallo-hydrolase [Deltaproteobacteria bacterium]|nr:MBL fold metallo-hydrolase [Deltaproteobacteria bacterium]MBW2697196.1 MBL fold metallo-hydrolase [Deltaproteobacteria bacterium]
MRRSILVYALGFLSCALLVTLIAAKWSPTGTAPDRDVYYPGTEKIGKNEMRVVALGTGMPSARPKQAAACWLVELGNGDKFLFDIGSGCHERLAAQMIPYDFLDKVFIGHLHVDHMGDLPTFWLGGTTMNRLVPLRIWGPSGGTPELGTKHAMDLMQKMYAWDIGTRSGVIDFRGGVLEINEFAFDGINEVIYDENGVKIRSIPAVHGLDGAVSFILEWNGLTFVYGSDTIPNKWYVEYAAGADLAVHECFLPATLLVTKQGFSPLEALTVGTQGHTSPEQFGKVMSLVEPRLAVGYHFFNDFDTEPEVRDRVRRTYDGPLALATDYMVFNVTKDEIRTRMSVVDEEVWPTPPQKKKIAPDVGSSIAFSKFTISGVMALPEVVGPIYDEINEKYGTDFEPLFKQ